MIRTAATIGLLALAACAHPTVERYNPATYKDGLIYNLPVPFLQVKGDGTSSVVYLPDPAQRYVIRVNGLFGSGELKPSLVDGWQLSGIDLTAPNPVGDIAQLALSAASHAVPLMRAAPRAVATATPGFYRIDVAHMRLVGPLQ